MANHIRQQARDLIVTAVSGFPITGTNVFKGSTRGREFPVNVVAVVQATDETIDDVLDAIGKEVEAGRWVVQTLGGIAKRLILVKTSREMDGDGTKVTGALNMEWLVRCATPENDATTSR